MKDVLYVKTNECDELSLNDLKDQIKIREELLQNMMGNVYPQIVRKEIRDIEDIIVKRSYKESWDGLWEV